MFYKTLEDQVYTGDKINESDTQLTDDEITLYVSEQNHISDKFITLSQIETLEKNQARALRELYLDSNNNVAKTKLQEIESQITELRTHLT